ncbi:MAG: PIN domain-containing protein [Firmicutes bacterium]|nr:PIN domain-containing protein [Bacillota bacterium]
MSDRVFLDTNILLYVYSDEEEKKQISKQIFREQNCLTCMRALNEFCNVCLKKWKFSRKGIAEAIEQITKACAVSPVSINTMLHALLIHERYGYSYYDCVMLASALENGCTIIYTEDLAAGQMIENRLLILNPFKG